MRATSSSPGSRNRFSWYHLYYALAFCGFATVLFSLHLNHRLLAVHADSVSASQVWADRLNRVANLGRQLAAVGAPGDDVFASHDPTAELARLIAARKEFAAALDSLTQELLAAATAAQAGPIQEILAATQLHAANVGTNAMQIFAAFASGARDHAGESMALMDRELNAADHEIMRLGIALRGIQSEQFAKQLHVARNMQRLELAVAVAVVLMIGAASVFGHKMAAAMRAHDVERARNVAQLQRAHDELEERVATRTRELHTLNEELLQEIQQRKEAVALVEAAQAQATKSARLAGMSEVATGVLHNVGNVLNSVNVSAGMLREHLKKSQLPNLMKATQLLRDHATDAVEFLTADAKGQRLPAYLLKLGEHLGAEQKAWEEELLGMGRNIEHIKEIVAMQQSYARLSGLVETLQVQDLVEDALRMNEAGIARLGIQVVRSYQSVSLVRVDKHKVLQILVNLIRNAKYAMSQSSRADKILTVTIGPTENAQVRVEVGDNGVGIAPENLTRIFQHGFTTKKDGHGFGLHSSVNAAREMGGQLFANSPGAGAGATFVLELPVAKIEEVESA